MSLLGFLRDSPDAIAAQPLFSEGLLRLDKAGEPQGLYRSVQWKGRKLVLDGGRRLKQLFDLDNDSKELRNLLPEERDSAEELMRELVRIHHDNLASP